MAEKIFDTDLRINGPGGPLIISGAGAPEGVVTAPVGSQFHRTDGGSGATLYVKESGTGDTGWVAMSAGGGIPSGTGSPEGFVTASVGSLYVQTDSDPGNVLWLKESGAGNTGWNRPLTIDANGFPGVFPMLPNLQLFEGIPADFPAISFLMADATPVIFISDGETSYGYWYEDDGFGVPYYEIIATTKRVSVGTTAPASPVLNDLWVDTN